MLSVLSSYAVSLWLRCLVCFLYVMNEYAVLCEYEYNTVRRKIYNIKLTLVTCNLEAATFLLAWTSWRYRNGGLIWKLKDASTNYDEIFQGTLNCVDQIACQGWRQGALCAGAEPCVCCSVLIHHLRALAAAGGQPVRQWPSATRHLVQDVSVATA